jgi:hypothetical protein
VFIDTVNSASKRKQMDGLDWNGLDWTGLDWTGLDWTGLDYSLGDVSSGLVLKRAKCEVQKRVAFLCGHGPTG